LLTHLALLAVRAIAFVFGTVPGMWGRGSMPGVSVNSHPTRPRRSEGVGCRPMALLPLPFALRGQPCCFFQWREGRKSAYRIAFEPFEVMRTDRSRVFRIEDSFKE
jgi:hypothetical protein